MFFLLEVHIIMLKALPTMKLTSKYTTPTLKYTKDIFMGILLKVKYYPPSGVSRVQAM